jgi:hypothetical protein
MPILFLDCDGVLVTQDSILAAHKHVPFSGHDEMHIEQIVPECMERLNTILRETSAQVVVSSTWRKLYSVEELQQLFEKCGFQGEVIGRTPSSADGRRGPEIALWLRLHGYDANDCVIIDDEDYDMAPLHHRLVKTTFKEGLQDEHITQALALLT